MDDIARLIKVNAETVPDLVQLHGAAVHGDYLSGGSQYWDLEFPNLHTAASFATTVLPSADVQSVDIRYGDSVTSLYEPVTLTLKARLLPLLPFFAIGDKVRNRRTGVILTVDEPETFSPRYYEKLNT